MSEHPTPLAAEELDECLTADDLANFVRVLAADCDRRHAHIYRAVEPARIRAGARVAQQILETHLALRQRMGRGARTGRRKHAQEIYRLRADTNDVDLSLAVAVLSITCFFAMPRERGD